MECFNMSDGQPVEETPHEKEDRSKLEEQFLGALYRFLRDDPIWKDGGVIEIVAPTEETIEDERVDSKDRMIVYLKDMTNPSRTLRPRLFRPEE